MHLLGLQGGGDHKGGWRGSSFTRDSCMLAACIRAQSDRLRLPSATGQDCGSPQSPFTELSLSVQERGTCVGLRINKQGAHSRLPVHGNFSLILCVPRVYTQQGGPLFCLRDGWTDRESSSMTTVLSFDSTSLLPT